MGECISVIHVLLRDCPLTLYIVWNWSIEDSDCQYQSMGIPFLLRNGKLRNSGLNVPKCVNSMSTLSSLICSGINLECLSVDNSTDNNEEH